MLKRCCIVAVLSLLSVGAIAAKVASPNGLLTIQEKNGRLVVCYEKQPVIELASLGLEDTPFQGGLAFERRVKADYQMLSGKRLHCENAANEYRSGALVLRVYNDGVAFRYEGTKPETTAYRIPEGTRRWMQQWADSYEGFFPLSTTCKQKPVPSYGPLSVSPDGWNNRWGYPALIETSASTAKGAKPVFALITEANIEKGQSASCLYNDGELFRVVADKKTDGGMTADHTPWRVIIVGHLNDVVASTLVTDVSEPCKIDDTSWILPGTVSWIYWAYNHGSNDYDIIKKYTDMAVTLHLPYVLIDAEWDTMKDGKTIEDAVAYARSKGIKPLIWYNSSVGWVDGAPTPKYRLNKPEDREREFAWCEQQGIAGVKIDFFSGDTQLNMDYCIDLLECAARHHLLVNFHGATIPRGWQRTYPNLLSTEGVYGAEWYNNVPTFTDKAACHNATLPFTRNVVGPMDYTPCTFSDSQHPHITSKGHELALTVLFESALQHLADRPESYLAQPFEVQQFLGQLPTVWDETRLLSGYPGESVVMARRRGNTWYVAGINGTDNKKTVELSLKSLVKKPKQMQFFGDADGQPDWKITNTIQDPLPSSLELQPRGGFVMVISL